tara:strand:+ start:3193 stop:3372 length:180 start_codon:yes stop_codon:yes gene_type:complete
MKETLNILQFCLKKIQRSRDFTELNNTIVSISQKKVKLSRSDKLILYREIKRKIGSYGY